jgi:protein involved in polysaccharide export with SLBB domain
VIVFFHRDNLQMMRSFVCLLVAALTTGCSAIDGLLETPMDAQAPAVGEHSISPTVAGWTGRAEPGLQSFSETDDGYILDTGDRLRIFVYGQPNLSRIYPLDQSGQISVPLIGTVKARGLTSQRLAQVIRNRLASQYVKEQYPYAGGLTVRSAVAIAGGFSERAKEQVVQITRRAEGTTEKFDVSDDFVIQPGDTIYVYERFL